MTRPAILQPGRSYTFRQYFEMTHEPEDISLTSGKVLFPLAIFGSLASSIDKPEQSPKTSIFT
jgi:hypothetical protein